MQRREGAFLKLQLSPFTFGSRFCPFNSTFLFQTLFPSIFFFSSRRKEKKEKKKKTLKKKKMQRNEGAYL